MRRREQSGLIVILVKENKIAFGRHSVSDFDYRLVFVLNLQFAYV